MRHTFRIIRAALRASFSRMVEYRGDLFGVFFAQLGFIASNLIALFVVLEQTDSLGEWNGKELALFYLFGMFVLALIHGAIAPNIRMLPDLIRTGNLDLLITKPANSLLLITFKEFSTRGLLEILVSFVFVVLGIWYAGIALTIPAVLLATAFLIIAIIAVWAFSLFLMTWSFWFLGIENASILTSSALGLGRIPVSFYGRAASILLRTFIPAALIGNIPVQILLGKVSSGSLIIAAIIGVIYTFVAIRFYAFAIKRYSSASS